MKIVLYKRNNLIGTAGGSEKVLCRFANEMTSRGHEVALMTRDYAVGVPFYPLSDKVRICNFPVSRDSSLNLVLRALDKLLFMVGGIIPAAAKLTRAYKRAVFMNERLWEEKPDHSCDGGNFRFDGLFLRASLAGSERGYDSQRTVGLFQTPGLYQRTFVPKNSSGGGRCSGFVFRV